jgi:hypothetical protein
MFIKEENLTAKGRTSSIIGRLAPLGLAGGTEELLIFFGGPAQVSFPHDSIKVLFLLHEVLTVLYVGRTEDCIVIIFREGSRARLEARYHFFVPIKLLMNNFFD